MVAVEILFLLISQTEIPVFSSFECGSEHEVVELPVTSRMQISLPYEVGVNDKGDQVPLITPHGQAIFLWNESGSSQSMATSAEILLNDPPTELRAQFNVLQDPFIHCAEGCWMIQTMDTPSGLQDLCVEFVAPAAGIESLPIDLFTAPLIPDLDPEDDDDVIAIRVGNGIGQPSSTSNGDSDEPAAGCGLMRAEENPSLAIHSMVFALMFLFYLGLVRRARSGNI